MFDSAFEKAPNKLPNELTPPLPYQGEFLPSEFSSLRKSLGEMLLWIGPLQPR